MTNFCVIFFLCEKTKNIHFKDLNIKNLSDGKNFWKNVKLYLSDKGLNCNTMVLAEKHKNETHGNTWYNYRR